MEHKKQESGGKSGSGSGSSSANSNFLIRFHADSDELQVEEIVQPSVPAPTSGKYEEEESEGSSESVSTCSSPVSAQDAELGQNRDSSPIKDYLSRFKRSITIDACSPASPVSPVAIDQPISGCDNRNYFSDFKERLTKRVEEIRNERLQRHNKVSKDSSFSDIDPDTLSPEPSSCGKIQRNPLSYSCGDINNTEEAELVAEGFTKSQKIEKLSLYLDSKLSREESIKSGAPVKTKESTEKKLKTDKPAKEEKKSLKKAISDLKKSDPSIRSYFRNRKRSYLTKGVVDAEKVEEAEEATVHYKMNQAQTPRQIPRDNVQLRSKISFVESLLLVVNWWKTFFGVVIFLIIHYNAPGYLSTFFAGFFLSMELRNLINFLLRKFGYQPTSCGDDMLFYTAFLNEEGVHLLSDSAIFNSPPEKIVHQDWMSELTEGDYNSDSFQLSQTETVYVHLDGPILFVSMPRFKIPKRAVWSEPQYKMLFNEKRMYVITDCSVDLVPEGLIRKRKWSRRFPIRIKLLPHSFIGACIRGNGQSTISDDAVWVPATNYVRRSASDYSVSAPDSNSETMNSKTQMKGGKSSGFYEESESQESKNTGESTVTRDQLDRNERYIKSQMESSRRSKPKGMKLESSSITEINEMTEKFEEDYVTLQSGLAQAPSSDGLIDDMEQFFDVESMDEDEMGEGSKEQIVFCGKKLLVSSGKDSLLAKTLYSMNEGKELPPHDQPSKHQVDDDVSAKEGSYLYLFCRTNRQKEAWFSYLSAATKFKISHGEVKTGKSEGLNDPGDIRDSSELPLPARKSKYLTYMYNLQQNVTPKAFPDISLVKDESCEPEVEIQLMWLNAILGRVTHEFSKNQLILNFIKKKIQQKLGQVSLPRFMDALNISNLEIEDVYPVIKRASRPTLDDRGIWVDLDVVYSGSSKLAIDTKLNLLKLKKANATAAISASLANLTVPEIPLMPDTSLPDTSLRRSAAFHSDVESESSGNSSDEERLLAGESRLHAELENELNPGSGPASAAAGRQRAQKKTGQKVLQFVDKFTATKFFESFIENKYVKRVVENVSNKDLSLMVDLKWLCGTLVINIPPPPIDRIWVGFRGNPKMVLSCYPRFGETEVSYMEVSKWIRKLLIREMEKNLVLPNMEDILLPSELIQAF